MAFTLRPDGRIHLAPFGDFPHGPLVQRLTPDNLAAVVEDWRAKGARELLLDFDHASRRDPDERDSEAAGWLSGFEVDADGLWARVRWSDTGRAAVTEGRFRYVSPVFGFPSVSAGTVEPVYLREAALTNKPNLPVLELANSLPLEPTTTMDTTEIAKLLGLPPEATAADIATAIKALLDSNAALSTECENARCSKAAEVANSLGLSGDKAKPFIELWKRDPKTAQELANSLPKPATRPGMTTTQPGSAPAREIANGAPAEVSAQREKLVAETQAKHRCGYQRAWELASKEKPELFR